MPGARRKAILALTAMQTYQFKTDASCGGCVTSIGLQLDRIDDIQEWSLNLDDPERRLTVQCESSTPEEIRQAVVKAGFRIEFLS